MAESAEELYRSIPAEFGWDEIVLIGTDGRDLIGDTEIEGATFKVGEYLNRQHVVRAKLPEEAACTLIPEGSGATIRQ
jgi:hypothetical protein